LGFLRVHSVGQLVWECETEDEVYFVLYGSLRGKAMGYLLRKDMSIGLEEWEKERVRGLARFGVL